MTLNAELNNFSNGMIGLNYEVQQVAVEFAGKYPVVRFGIRKSRIEGLWWSGDDSSDVDPDKFRTVSQRSLFGISGTCSDLQLTSIYPPDLAVSNVFIVTEPTPIDYNKRPDITLLVRASEPKGKAFTPSFMVIGGSSSYLGGNCLAI